MTREIEILLDKLDSAGSIGLDGSPGDSLCKEAAKIIRELILLLKKEKDDWNRT